jgi:nucleotide-binding universal stress UspA family protein
MTTPALEPGTVIDGFVLEEIIHRGSMATLWRAHREGLAQPRVLKIPLLRHGDTPAAIVGFEVEQMIMPTLFGAHVPRLFGIGDFSARPYIAMELIDGPSLRARLDDAPLPYAEVAEIGAKVAGALHDIHRQHVIHLDLKPSNVLFRSTGQAVLIDFGLSLHERLPDLLAEEFRLPLGTGPYISPEQVLGIRNEPRSDLFSLGVTLYHLATGHRPFGNPTTIRGLRGRLYQEPVPPRVIDPSFPPWLQEVILRCLEVDPNARYDTAGQLAFDLQHPQQVKLTERAQQTLRDNLIVRTARWLRAIGSEPIPRHSVSEHLTKAPIIVAAVDLTQGKEALAETLRVTARRLFQTEPSARLACVTVLKTPRIAIDVNVDEEGRNLHVQHLVVLKDWARPLHIPSHRITYHVLQSPDPAAAIIDYARSNGVDHIIIGARASSTLRRYLGSVSSKVVAEAPCNVTVVRTTGAQAGTDEEPSGR